MNLVNNKTNPISVTDGADAETIKNKLYNSALKKVNPFLDSNGNLVNKYINYQQLLDSDKTNNKVKDFISQATGLVQTKKQNDVTDKLQTNVIPSNYKLGSISAKYEAGGFNGGAVSSGNGDYGGISYGIPQFSTKSGSADNFVSWLKKVNPNMGSVFGNTKAGTTDFTNAWKNAYSKYGDDFSSLQTQYAFENYAKPLADLAKQKTGVDYTRSPALQELVYSTALQFGSGNLGLSALGNVNSNMSDTDIINASYDNKISNYKSYFKDSSSNVQESVKNRFKNERNDILSLVGGNYSGSSNTSNLKVGSKIANTSSYNNNAAKGQCVWYVRGRAKEKLGFDPGALGNGNQMWYNAPKNAKLAATVDNLRPNQILSYQSGTSSAGQKYGHVVFIENVIGDTVYYTEGGSGYYKNGTDGVVKTATRQGILNGVNSNGSRIGSGAIGLIDLSKY